MFTQAELLVRLLKALDLWPPAGFIPTYTRSEILTSLDDVARHLAPDTLQAIHWAAVILSLKR